MRRVTFEQVYADPAAPASNAAAAIGGQILVFPKKSPERTAAVDRQARAEAHGTSLLDALGHKSKSVGIDQLLMSSTHLPAIINQRGKNGWPQYANRSNLHYDMRRPLLRVVRREHAVDRAGIVEIVPEQVITSSLVVIFGGKYSYLIIGSMDPV
jgi:hypothetical protein